MKREGEIYGIKVYSDPSIPPGKMVLVKLKVEPETAWLDRFRGYGMSFVKISGEEE